MPSSSPVPFLMARSMVSLGMLPALASMIAYRKRRLAFGSPPPDFAATMMPFASLLHSLPRLLSITDFLRAMFAQCECPAIAGEDAGYGMRGSGKNQQGASALGIAL